MDLDNLGIDCSFSRLPTAESQQALVSAVNLVNILTGNPSNLADIQGIAILEVLMHKNGPLWKACEIARLGKNLDELTLENAFPREKNLTNLIPDHLKVKILTATKELAKKNSNYTVEDAFKMLTSLRLLRDDSDSYIGFFPILETLVAVADGNLEERKILRRQHDTNARSISNPRAWRRYVHSSTTPNLQQGR